MPQSTRVVKCMGKGESRGAGGVVVKRDKTGVGAEHVDTQAKCRVGKGSQGGGELSSQQVVARISQAMALFAPCLRRQKDMITLSRYV